MKAVISLELHESLVPVKCSFQLFVGGAIFIRQANQSRQIHQFTIRITYYAFTEKKKKHGHSEHFYCIIPLIIYKASGRGTLALVLVIPFLSHRKQHFGFKQLILLIPLAWKLNEPLKVLRSFFFPFVKKDIRTIRLQVVINMHRVGFMPFVWKPQGNRGLKTIKNSSLINQNSNALAIPFGL